MMPSELHTIDSISPYRIFFLNPLRFVNNSFSRVDFCYYYKDWTGNVYNCLNGLQVSVPIQYREFSAEICENISEYMINYQYFKLHGSQHFFRIYEGKQLRIVRLNPTIEIYEKNSWIRLDPEQRIKYTIPEMYCWGDGES